MGVGWQVVIIADPSICTAWRAGSLGPKPRYFLSSAFTMDRKTRVLDVYLHQHTTRSIRTASPAANGTKSITLIKGLSGMCYLGLGIG